MKSHNYNYEYWYQWIRNCWMLLHMRQADASCTLSRWQHYSAWNDVMAAISKIWLYIRLNAYCL